MNPPGLDETFFCINFLFHLVNPPADTRQHCANELNGKTSSLRIKSCLKRVIKTDDTLGLLNAVLIIFDKVKIN